MKGLVIAVQLFIWFVIFSVTASFVYAGSELTVADNGQNSSNGANISSSRDSTIYQSNDSSIQNTISSSSNTGGNSASSNSGTTSITSGSVVDQITVANQGINTNVAQAGTSSINGTATISGNGQNSTNTIAVSGGSSNSVSQSNNAAITSTTITYANTGSNRSTDNFGTSSIQTGAIYSTTSILNKDINNAVADVGTGTRSFNAKIDSNGANSENLITVVNNSKNDVHVQNYADIKNTDVQYLTTGLNSANDNLGGVFIVTGDIVARKSIENIRINTSVVTVSEQVCETPQPPAPQKEVTPPSTSTTPSGGGGTGGGSGIGGSSSSTSGKVLGSMLPVTGSYWLILLTLGNLIAFFMGWYLRFRSGCAPGYISA